MSSIAPVTTTKPKAITTTGAKKPAGWVWPAQQTRLSGYHYTATHHAIDIAARTGDKILSPTGGTVIRAGWDNSGYGNLVVIKTNTGQTVYLAHLSKIEAKVGQKVAGGQEIGRAGTTGNSTGPHLHFEIRTAGGGGYVDPYSIYGSKPKTSGVTLPPGYTGTTTTTGTTKKTPAVVPVSIRGQPLPNPQAGTTTPTGAVVTESGAVVSTQPVDLFGINAAVEDFKNWWNTRPWADIEAGGIGLALVIIGLAALVFFQFKPMVAGAVSGAVEELG